MATTASSLAHRLLTALALLILSVPLAVVPLGLLASIVGGGLVTSLVLATPPAGLALLAFAIPFGDPLTLPVGGLNVGAVSALALLTALAWIGSMVLRRAVWIGMPPLLPALVPLVLVTLLALPAVPALAPGLKELFRWLELAVVYVVASHLMRPPALRLLLGATFVAASAEALLGWYQFFARAGPPDYAIGPFLRAYGTFGQPNPFAGYLSAMFLLALGVAYGQLRAKGAADRPLLAASLLTLGLAGLAVLMSFSRGAWLGLAVGAAVLIGATGKRGALAVVSAGMLGLLVAVAGSLDLLPRAVALRLGDALVSFSVFDARAVVPTNDNFAVVDRMAHWQAAWEMYREYPLLGVGPGQYEVFYPEFRLPLWPDAKGHAHNFYLHTLAELGALGAIALAAFLVSAAWCCFQAARRASGPQRGVALGALGALVALATHSAFDHLLVHGLNAQLGLLLALASGPAWCARLGQYVAPTGSRRPAQTRSP